MASKPKTISVVLTTEANRKLTDAAKKAGRSRQLEAMLRLHEHLKSNPELKGNYWEMTSME